MCDMPSGKRVQNGNSAAYCMHRNRENTKYTPVPDGRNRSVTGARSSFAIGQFSIRYMRIAPVCAAASRTRESISDFH